jgi:hypothetical protein
MHLKVSLHISNWRYLVGIEHLQPCKTKRTYSAHNFVVGTLPVPALLYPLCYSIMTPGASTSYLRSRTQVCDKPAITQEISNTLSQINYKWEIILLQQITDTWDRKITNTRTWTSAEYTDIHSSSFRAGPYRKTSSNERGRKSNLRLENLDLTRFSSSWSASWSGNQLHQCSMIDALFRLMRNF